MGEDSCVIGSTVCQRRNTTSERNLARQAAEKLLFIHAVFEGFAAIDKNDWDLVIKLAAKFRVGVHVNFLPGEAATAREFGETFLDHLAEMTSLARVNDDLPEDSHAWIVAFLGVGTPVRNREEVQTRVR